MKVSRTGDYKGLVFLLFIASACSDIGQANILITNETPPRACLADFGSLTMVANPNGSMPCNTQSDSVATFMSPELLVPSKFGVKDSVPTMEADIYAFGLVIFQVNKWNSGHATFFNSVQVLTGTIPFRNLRLAELVVAVVEGKRPDKPDNALEIGFSDSLWDFVQVCWDRDRERRPKVAGVVERLCEAAVNWHDPMPPRARLEPVTPAPKGEGLEHCESDMLMFPQHHL